MEIKNGTNIVLSTWFPPCGQGLTIFSSLVFVKYVFDPTKKKVHLDSTIDVVQHELKHAEQIKRMFILLRWLWIPKMLLQYIIYGHDKSPLEIEAKSNEQLWNLEFRALLIAELNQKFLDYY